MTNSIVFNSNFLLYKPLTHISSSSHHNLQSNLLFKAKNLSSLFKTLSAILSTPWLPKRRPLKMFLHHQEEQPRNNLKISYSSTQIGQRLALFRKRKIISSKFISQTTLEKMGCYDEDRIMLENMGMYNFSFNAYPTYPSLVYEFLSSYCLRNKESIC